MGGGRWCQASGTRSRLSRRHSQALTIFLSTWKALWRQVLLASFSQVLPKRFLHAEHDGRAPVNKHLSFTRSKPSKILERMWRWAPRQAPAPRHDEGPERPTDARRTRAPRSGSSPRESHRTDPATKTTSQKTQSTEEGTVLGTKVEESPPARGLTRRNGKSEYVPCF